MTGKTSYLSAGNELFRWDADGNLIYVEPDLLQQITGKLRDEQGLTVWERLDGCDRALVQLTSQVTALQQQYAQMQNDLSLLPSIQRSYMDLEKRLIALEGSRLPAATAREVPASYVQHSAPFGSRDKLVEQIEKMFNCKDGDYWSCHQEWRNDEKASGYASYPYTTVGLLAPAAIYDAQERLRQALYTSFQKLKVTCKSKRPVLYWRYGVIERIQEDIELTVGQGSGVPVPVKYKIMTRIAIPEADFSVIDGVIKADSEPYASLRE